MKAKLVFFLVVMILFNIIPNSLLAEQKSLTLLHKPQIYNNTGYEFSIKVVWNIIKCFDKIKINIGADVNGISIDAYYFEGKRYTPADLGMTSFKSNILTINLEARLKYESNNYTDLGRVIMKNVGSWTVGGCFGQTFDINDNLNKNEYYFDHFDKISVSSISITNESFPDEILNTKIRDLEKRDKKYDDLLYSANQKYSSGEYKNAMILYKQAFAIKKEGFVEGRIETCEEKLPEEDKNRTSVQNDKGNDYSGTSGTFTDSRDGEVYTWVKIGNQVWMAENLRATKYRNGDMVSLVKDNNAWGKLNYGAYCYYLNDQKYNDTFGVLYNYFAIDDKRGIAPEGWHLPSDEEWEALALSLGGSSAAGAKLKNTRGWNNSGNGTNDYGFSVFPSGCRSYYFGGFMGDGQSAFLWTSPSSSTSLYLARKIDAGSGELIKYGTYYKYDGYSVRCVRDEF